jgi:hypothetical protein
MTCGEEGHTPDIRNAAARRAAPTHGWLSLRRYRMSNAPSAGMAGCPTSVWSDMCQQPTLSASSGSRYMFSADGLSAGSLMARKINKCLERSRPRPETLPLTWAFT